VVLAACLLLALALPASAQPRLRRCTAHITSATTTTPTGCAAVTGGIIELWSASICVDAGGTATSITLQDGAGTNLIGPSVVYPIPAGACFVLQRSTQAWYATAAGQALRIVTSDVGPLEVALEIVE
jgi:hypothetical protein